MKNIYYFLIIVAFFISVPAYQQPSQLQFINVDIEDGLTQNTVNCMMQDADGFLWIGTDYGLCRYDGYHFDQFYSTNNGENSLLGNKIKGLFQDFQGNIWIHTNSGINIYNPANEKFKSYYKNENDLNRLLIAEVQCFFQDWEGNIWFGSLNGLHVFPNSYENNSGLKTFFGQQNDSNSLGSKEINHIVRDKFNYIWICHAKGIDKITTLDLPYNNISVKRLQVKHNEAISCNKASEDNHGNLWVATDKGLFVVKNNKLIPFWEGATCKELIIDSQGYLWLYVTDVGLMKSMLSSSKLITYLGKRMLNIHSFFYNINENPYTEGQIASTNITDLLIDKNQVLWLGTDKAGVYKADLNRKQFIIYKIPSHTKTTNIVENIVSICGNNSGKLLFSNSNSLYITSVDNKKMEEIKLPFRDIAISAMDAGQKNTLWIASNNNAIYALDIQYRNILKKILINNINTISALKYSVNNEIWCATDQGLLYIKNPEGNPSIEIFSMVNENPNFNDENFLHAIFPDDNTIWCGSQRNGLFCFDIEKKSFIKNYYTNKKDTNTISSNTVFSIYKDSEGLLWLGTDAGLNILNKDGNFKHFNTLNGLPANVITAITEDKNNFIWLSTLKGLSCLNKTTNTVRNYYKSDGLQSNEFNKGSFFNHIPSGKLFFGNSKGFIGFQPDSIKNNETASIPIIKELKINNKKVPIGERFLNQDTVLWKSICQTSEIILKWWQNEFVFEFTSSHYAAPELNQYKYKLEGYDKEWKTTSYNRRYATYTNIKPGNYTFELYSSNNDGIWTEKPARLKIRISPPFWKTTLFFVFSVLVIVGMLFLFYFIRINHYKKQQLRLEKLVELRTKEVLEQKKQIEQQIHELKILNATKDKFFSIIAHDLKNPFHAILGFSEMLSNKYHTFSAEERKDFLKIIHNSAKLISELLENLLSWARTQKGEIHIIPEYFNLNQLVNEIFSLLALSASLKNIKLINEINPDTIIYSDINMMKTIIRNIVNNSIKFTASEGWVKISMQTIDNKYYISISDNGIGMKKEIRENIFRIDYTNHTIGTAGEKGTGLGLLVCKEFIEKNNGFLTIDSEEGKGSTFNIILPVAGIAQTQESLNIQHTETETNNPEQPDETIVLDDTTLSEKHSLLVIDDNPIVHNAIKIELKDNFDILEAFNGQSGYEIALKTRPDVIICDINMPGIDGIEFTKIVRNDSHISHIPIILITAFDDENTQLQGIDSGADDFILKPLNINFLVKKIHYLIKSREHLRKKYSKQQIIDPADINITPADQTLIEKAKKIIEDNLSNTNFSNDDLCRELNLSRTQLYKKIKSLTNFTVSDFIQNIRLKIAAQYLSVGKYGVSETAYFVGFNNRNYFSKLFKEQFGLSPKEFKVKIQKNKKKN